MKTGSGQKQPFQDVKNIQNSASSSKLIDAASNCKMGKSRTSQSNTPGLGGSMVGGITAVVDMADENQMKHALEANIQEKQEQVDKMQIHIQRLNFELQTKIERCQYLRSLFDTKSRETSETEQTLKKETSEVQERLEILQLFTKREKHNHKQLKEKNSYKLEQLEGKVAQLKQERETLGLQIDETEIEIEKMQENLTIKLNASVRPLEEAKLEIDQQIKLYSSRRKICEQHKERKEYLKESQLLQLSKVNDELQAIQLEISRLESEVEEVRSTHPDEFEIFTKEYQEEKQLKQVLMSKQKFEEKSSKLEKFINRIKGELDGLEKEQEEHQKKDIQKLRRIIKECNDFQLNQPQSVIMQKSNLKRNQEIKKVESFLREKENDFFSTSLSQVVYQEFGVDMRISTYQVRRLRAHLEKFKQDGAAHDEQLEEEIQKLREDITRRSDSQTDETKWMNQKYCQLIENQKEQKYLNEKKAKMIEMEIRRIEIESAQGSKEMDLENVKLTYLKKMWARMNCDQDERKNFQNIFEMYLERITQREQTLSEAIELRDDLLTKLNVTADEIQKKRIQVLNNSEDLDKYKSQIKELVKKEKVLSKSLEERATQIEFQLFKFGERSFEEYYQKHEQLFEGVKKTYGKKVCDKMKTQQKREFIQITVDQYKRRIMELKNKQFLIEQNYDKKVETEKKHKEVIEYEINKIQRELNNQNNELQIVEYQLQAAVDAMCEIDKEIDTLRTARCLEIKKSVTTLFKHRNYDNHKVRVSTLNEEISKKEKLIQRLKDDLDDKDTNVFEKTTNFKAEESQLRVRFENLKKAQCDIQKAIKPQLIAMEREIKELGYSINSGRKRLEAFFERYQQLLSQQTLIKKTLFERFAIDYDQAVHTENVRQFVTQDCEDDALENMTFQGKGFHFEEEFKKMQNVIDIDEKLKHQPLNNQIIHEITEENEEEERSVSKSVEGANQKIKKATQKKDNFDRIGRNMEDLMSCASVDENLSSPSQHQLRSFENALEISTLGCERLVIDLSGCLQIEIEFFNKIKALLQGEEIFKKFGNSSSMTQKPFDPLDPLAAPEQKGYGKRLFILKELTRFDLVKQCGNTTLCQIQQITEQSQSQSNILNQTSTNKNVVEASIPLEKVMKLLIPSITQDIIKYQRLNASTFQSQSSIQVKNQKQLMGAKRDQEEHRDKCLQAKYYPFSLALSDKTLEFVCTDLVQFKVVTEAIEDLLKKKSSSAMSLTKLAKRISFAQY